MIEPAKPPHDRKSDIIEVSLTMVRIQNSWKKAYNEIQPELEAVLIETIFLWVSIFMDHSRYLNTD